MLIQVLSKPIVRQYVIVVIMNLSVLGVGLGIAWPSPMLVKLRNSTQTILEEPITEEEGSWIVSLGFLISTLMNFGPALLIDRIGRKYTLLVGSLPRVVGALMMTLATQVWMIIVGRVLVTISDVYIFTVVPMYASEIASKDVRGALGTILQIMCSLGIVIMLSFGPFISYIAANVLFTTGVVIGLLSIVVLPESPYYLYAKGRSEESLKLLTLLRGNESAAKEELKEFAASSTEETSRMYLFKDRMFWKSVVLVALLSAGSQLIGFNAVTFYLQTVLESTETSVRPEIASVIIGLIQLTASFFTTIVTDRFGRKPILCVTMMGMMVGMVGLGVFFYVKGGSGSIAGFMNFLPLLSLILVVFCYSAGPGSVNWALSAELFDNSARGLGLTVSSVPSGLFFFLTTKYFAYFTVTIGAAITYWIFSANCLLYCIFIWICVPETKGKSFGEIQDALRSKPAGDVEKHSD